ncbi:HAD family hydrolase [Lachnoclostridium phytofermentans]|uniref:Haloacid dehalogenase domain protein hydrolase n=1 Tax=Lachnoclostridium phytofermentans (strain ATCC 700394 / DSM 18823 / ISDg) TaxID=357809 RepID=A9KIJ0_LACP7|nr:HAD family hydrolase [Lachnoclostridium phytofermentans]ABX42442.1 Haloacid dehalogenase domain protein hydrolase [Lachnoclostridium phytofermentans ISDg]
MTEKITTVLFDLDGTLLPFDQEEFIHSYFKRLAIKLIPMGFEKDALIKAIWTGMEAMIHNDGTKTNEVAFWEVFEGLLQTKRELLEEVFLDFYQNEFDAVKEVVTGVINHRALIDRLKSKGYQLVLATNPVFPREAVATRLSWVQLSLDDFYYVTTFENSSYCKPSLGYYLDILKAIDKLPEECVMIGNNTLEDMVSGKLGITTGLVTTNLENQNNYDVNEFTHGTLEEVVDKLL